MIAFQNLTDREFGEIVKAERRARNQAAHDLQRQMPDLSLSEALRAVDAMVLRAAGLSE